jgi:hypothetical protein
MLLFYNALFLLTGIAQTMIQQSLFYVGAAEKSTLLPTAATYFGVSLNLILPLLGVGEAKRPTGSDVGDKEKARSREGTLLFGLALGLLEVIGNGTWTFRADTYKSSAFVCCNQLRRKWGSFFRPCCTDILLVVSSALFIHYHLCCCGGSYVVG